MSETEQKVKDIIVEQLGVNPAEVTDAATFDGDLGADSLDIMELVLAFEEAFKDETGKSLEIPDDDAAKIKTVGDAVNYIKEKQGVTT
jgi:acyl carrier protein